MNWDPKFQTAISDLEVQQVEVKGHLWHIRYPIEGEPDLSITVATTRPETMLGDAAVAVHPEDERYRDLVGRTAILPLVGRRIPIVADAYSDPEKGTGAVKITPAHDFNDFEVGRRHGLPLINVLGPEGQLDLEGTRISSATSSPGRSRAVLALDGQDRFEARKRIVAMLEERGVLDRVEPHKHTVPHGDRSGAVVEPYLTDQWYVNVQAARRARARSGARRANALRARDLGEDVFPVAREHRAVVRLAPALVGSPDPGLVRRRTAMSSSPRRRRRRSPRRSPTTSAGHGDRGRGDRPCRGSGARRGYLMRDEDVLDTWFSSALWPFSTLGWPDETPELGATIRRAPSSPASTSSSSGSPA